MLRVPIKQHPNQSISIIQEEISYDLIISTISGIAYASISINGEEKVSFVKCNINQPIIPFGYLHVDAGNFIFTSVDNAYPSYQDFNVSTFLRYITIEGDIL